MVIPPGSAAHPVVYPLNTLPEQTSWFTVKDCIHRYSLVVAGFTFAITTTPISFMRYTFAHNMLWYGTVPGFIMSLGFPIMPVVLCGVQVRKQGQTLRSPPLAASPTCRPSPRTSLVPYIVCSVRVLRPHAASSNAKQHS